MEDEEISYSTVVFKNGGPPPKEEKPEEPPIYSEVKSKETATAAPEEKPEEPPIYSEVKSEATATAAPEADGKQDAFPWLCVLAVCLGILGVILVGFIIAVIYMSVTVNEQQADLSSLTAVNQQLIMARNILQTKTDKQQADLSNLTAELSNLTAELSNLTAELSNLTAVNQQLIMERNTLQTKTDNLNWTLNTILTFDTFPVSEYCQKNKCQPCPKNWILFQEKCYLIYLKDNPWFTWKDSRGYCQNARADLVVIDSVQEQEFISKQTKWYFDHFHGYWVGLYKENTKWFWVDGRNDTLKYLLEDEKLGSSGSCMLVIPNKPFLTNWDPAGCIMENRFICEMDSVKWPN